MHVIDLEGNEYALQATSTNDNETNGNQSLSATIEYNKVNALFIKDIEQMWNVVDHDNVEQKIIYLKRQGIGNKMTVSIKGIPLFFDVLDNDRMYERHDAHMTAQVAFTRIFADTGFEFVLVDSFKAVQWEGFGDGESKLETFKRAINRYKCEFRIDGKTVYLESQIGNDTNNMYRHRFNASNIVQEVDAKEMWTYIRGYGDYSDGDGHEDAKLKLEYESPLAKLIGKRHAPPIMDGRIKSKSELENKMKEVIEDSLKISVSANIHALKKQNYPVDTSQVGDRVFLIDERINLNDEVRIVSRSVTRDWTGKITAINLTFGSEGLTKRHQSNINTAIKTINDVVEGKVELPFSSLNEAVKKATKALQDAQTELDIGKDGIVAIDPNNSNRLVLLNSAGLGVSSDGGKSFEEAITYLGINTNLLTAGEVHTRKIKIFSDKNTFYWDGNELKAVDPNDSAKYVKLTSGLLDISKGAIRIKRPDGYTTVNDGMLNTDFAVQFSPTPHYSSGVEHEGYYVKTSDTDPRIIANGRFRRDGQYLKLIVGLWTTSSGNTAKLRVRGQGNNPTIYATVTETSQDGGSESAQRTITVDLGVPNGNRTSFYVELYSDNGDEVRGYVHSAWLEG